MHCPKCQSTKIIKYGHTHYGKPRFRCLDCGRQFVENPSTEPIDEATRAMIDKMLYLAISIGCDSLRDATRTQELQVFQKDGYRCMLIASMSKSKSKLLLLKKNR